MIDDLHSLRLFCDVARRRSFSEAAAESGVSQSAVSQRISALEKRLGVTLLDRSVRPLSLTAAGEVLLKESLFILGRYDGLADRLNLAGAALSGSVRVEAIYSAGIDLLSQAADAFEARFPKVQVQVRYARPEEVYESVRHGECDLGIVSYPQRWGSVGVIRLRDERTAVVCSPTHPLAGREVVNASELGAWRMVTFDQNLPAGRSIRRYLKEHGVTPQVTHQFDNIDTLKNAVGVHDHFTILPERTVAREQAAGLLAVVRLEPPLLRPMGIIHRRHGAAQAEFAPAVEGFIEHLVQRFGPGDQQTSAPAPDADRPNAARTDRVAGRNARTALYKSLPNADPVSLRDGDPARPTGREGDGGSTAASADGAVGDGADRVDEADVHAEPEAAGVGRRKRTAGGRVTPAGGREPRP